MHTENFSIKDFAYISSENKKKKKEIEEKKGGEELIH